jgi:hypothetical protein
MNSPTMHFLNSDAAASTISRLLGVVEKKKIVHIHLADPPQSHIAKPHTYPVMPYNPCVYL